MIWYEEFVVKSKTNVAGNLAWAPLLATVILNCYGTIRNWGHFLNTTIWGQTLPSVEQEGADHRRCLSRSIM